MDGKEKSVSEIQQQLMLWVEQTKRLLVSLPSCLSELEQLKGEAGKFYDRINELERENRELRQTHEDLNQTFGKLKELIVGPRDQASQKVADAPEPSAFASKVRLFSGSGSVNLATSRAASS